MKKIIVALGAVVFAASVQAASVYWTATNVYAGNTTDKASGIAYFVTTSMATVDSWSSLNSAAQFESALASAYSYTPTTAGTYSKTSANAVANATLGLADSTAYTGYLIVFDGATIADSTSYYISNTKDFSTLTGTSNASVSFGTQKTNSQNAANWHAVPEPTSGLLMLVGLGALALRRRRA